MLGVLILNVLLPLLGQTGYGCPCRWGRNCRHEDGCGVGVDAAVGVAEISGYAVGMGIKGWMEAGVVGFC